MDRFGNPEKGKCVGKGKGKSRKGYWADDGVYYEYDEDWDYWYPTQARADQSSQGWYDNNSDSWSAYVWDETEAYKGGKGAGKGFKGKGKGGDCAKCGSRWHNTGDCPIPDGNDHKDAPGYSASWSSPSWPTSSWVGTTGTGFSVPAPNTKNPWSSDHDWTRPAFPVVNRMVRSSGDDDQDYLTRDAPAVGVRSDGDTPESPRTTDSWSLVGSSGDVHSPSGSIDDTIPPTSSGCASWLAPTVSQSTPLNGNAKPEVPDITAPELSRTATVTTADKYDDWLTVTATTTAPARIVSSATTTTSGTGSAPPLTGKAEDQQVRLAPVPETVEQRDVCHNCHSYLSRCFVQLDKPGEDGRTHRAMWKYDVCGVNPDGTAHADAESGTLKSSPEVKARPAPPVADAV